MKNVFIFLILLSLIPCSFAQAPDIEWQNTIGGSSYDYFTDLKITSDGGYILGGYSQSNISTDKGENIIGPGSNDYWIVKVDSMGNVVWENTIGGNWDDNFESLNQTLDGGYILGGWSNSGMSGDKDENAIVEAYYDYWAIKIDAFGEIEWQNTIGGAAYDYLVSVKQTNDGGYILGGSSSSGISGDKTEDLIGSGTTDYWIVKLNSAGNIQWQKTIGGNGFDYLESVQLTTDGGYILGGRSNSGISGNKTEPNIGEYDYWVLKLNSSGEIEWQNTIGGTEEDNLYTLQQTADEGFILGGFSTSGISDDKTEENIGGDDYWIIKLTEDGIIEWENTIGGTSTERLNSIVQTYDGGYFLGGWSSSPISGDKTESSYGSYDFWCIKLDDDGEILWQKTIGGNSEDVLMSVQQNEDNSFILGGYSASGISGVKTEINLGVSGSYDYWIVKLYGETCSIPSGLYADNIAPTYVKTHWDLIPSAEKYQLFYREFDGTTWTKLIAESNFKNIYDLSPETTYEYKVRTKCDGENTMFSPVEYFTTLPLKAGEINDQFIIYPNPSSENIIITLSSKILSTQHLPLTITDLSGKIIVQLNISSSETTIDISNYPSGIYFVQISNEQVKLIEKIIVE